MQNQEPKDVEKDDFFFKKKKKKTYLIIALKNCVDLYFHVFLI